MAARRSHDSHMITLGCVQWEGRYGYCATSKFGRHQLATTSSTVQVERGVSSLPRVLLMIRCIPSTSSSPASSSPEGSLKKVVPAGLGPKPVSWPINSKLTTYLTAKGAREADCAHVPGPRPPRFVSFLSARSLL